MLEINKIYHINALDGLRQLPDACIDSCISSPAYWGLRQYLDKDNPNKKYELGCEPYFKDYLNNLITIYKEVYRVLKPTGTCFVNLGESYYGGGKGDGETNKARKQLTNIDSNTTSGKAFNHGELNKSCMCNIPSRFAIKMTDELGFVQRNEIIWHKTNAMPQSMQNRFSHDYEKIFFFTKKSNKYFFEQQFEPLKEDSKRRAMRGVSKDNKYASGEGLPEGVHANTMSKGREFIGYDNMEQLIAEGKTVLNPNGRNMRSVWSISTKSNKFAHFAMYPEDLVERIIKAGCPTNGIVLDPFMGGGTTAVVAKKLGRNYIGFELNKEYIDISNQRLNIIEYVAQS